MKKKLFLALICLFQFSTFCLARAGGGGGGFDGGGGGDGGGYDGSYGDDYFYHRHYSSYSSQELEGMFSPPNRVASIIILSVLSSIFFFGIFRINSSFIRWYKRQRAGDVLRRSYNEDPLWNPDQMRARVEKVFRAMQDGWTKNDLTPYESMMSPALFRNYQSRLNYMRVNGQQNVLSDIQIESIEFVQAQDMVDNNQDTFAVYIRGTMIDYMQLQTANGIFRRGNGEPEDFEDLYYFVRRGNEWLLDDIAYDPEFTDFFQLRSRKKDSIDYSVENDSKKIGQELPSQNAGVKYVASAKIGTAESGQSPEKKDQTDANQASRDFEEGSPFLHD